MALIANALEFDNPDPDDPIKLLLWNYLHKFASADAEAGRETLLGFIGVP
ncbi:MAG: hypothetical protein Q4A31_10445 [Corynebacterium sp.]|nr:hypothetical protein [Corynebacterium sp.]MDO4762328.1 hypothetical protein [Corynebacterium sp.]